MPSYTHILPHHQYPAPDLYICYNESTLTDQYHQKSIGFNLGILYSIGLDRMNYTYHFGIIQKSFTVLKYLENEFSFQVFAALIWLCMYVSSGENSGTKDFGMLFEVNSTYAQLIDGCRSCYLLIFLQSISQNSTLLLPTPPHTP